MTFSSFMLRPNYKPFIRNNNELNDKKRFAGKLACLCVLMFINEKSEKPCIGKASIENNAGKEVLLREMRERVPETGRKTDYSDMRLPVSIPARPGREKTLPYPTWMQNAPSLFSLLRVSVHICVQCKYGPRVDASVDMVFFFFFFFC